MRFFRCEPYKVAVISTQSCAARWNKAQDARGDLGAALAACRKCSAGAAHAGHGRVNYSPWYKNGVCPRCGNGGRRIIGGKVCVSCWNRAREMRLGRNARGNRPVELLARPLHRVVVLVTVDGVTRRHVDPESSGLTETVIHFLQNNAAGEISFGRAPDWLPPSPGAPSPADDPADDAGVEPDESPPGTDGGDGWLLTDSRCRACRARILRSASPPMVHRCADCGAEGEGQPEEAPDVDPPTSGKPAPDLEVRRLEVRRYRARLFATAARVDAQWRWGRAQLRLGAG
jgi:hypothetical protein